MAKDTIDVRALLIWALANETRQSIALYPNPQNVIEVGTLTFFDWVRERTGHTEDEINALLDEVDPKGPNPPLAKPAKAGSP